MNLEDQISLVNATKAECINMIVALLEHYTEEHGASEDLIDFVGSCIDSIETLEADLDAPNTKWIKEKK